MLVRRALQVVLAVSVALAGAAGAVGTVGSGVATAQDVRHVRPQTLYYNHAYGVLDRETADAIEHSEYLREFANFQVRTMTGSDGRTWTGRYLLGRETYLELFGAGDLPGQDGEIGAGGMGVSVEREGQLARVVDRLRELGVTDPVEFRQTRDFGDSVPVPWFDAVFTTDRYDAFGAWGMEYRPEYFADPRSGTEPPGHPGDVGRERYLNDDYRDRLLRDITSVRLAVTARDLANTVPLLRAGGFRIRSTEGGGVVARGGGTTLRFDAVPRAKAGLKQVGMSLNRPVKAPREKRIGNSTLTVGPGARAVWTFDGPA
ncbi:DUF5829 family protein [Streptomyces sp. NPDC048172]|uniref:DUF5829 family protein n=1 Tax=Streptomyces sp. NPDC048172 TaxID=3365505 RepID=UPI003710D4EC